MSDGNANSMHAVQFNEVVAAKSPSGERLVYDDLKNVRLTITAELGQAFLLVRDILELKQGSIIPLNKLAGEMTDISLNGIPLARGEVVVISDSIHVRVAEIFGLVNPEKEAGDDDS